MNHVVLPNSAGVLCGECSRLHLTVERADRCDHAPGLVDAVPLALRSGCAVAVGWLAMWLCSIILFVILPAYIAWH